MKKILFALMIAVLAACGGDDHKSPFTNGPNPNLQNLLTARYSLDCTWRSYTGGSGSVTFAHTSSRDVGLEGGWSGSYSEMGTNPDTGYPEQWQYQVQMTLRQAGGSSASGSSGALNGDASATYQSYCDGRFDGTYPMNGTFSAKENSVRIDLRSPQDPFASVSYDCTPR